MTTNLRSFLYPLGKLLALPWRLATYQPPAAGPARRLGSPGATEEDLWGRRGRE